MRLTIILRRARAQRKTAPATAQAQFGPIIEGIWADSGEGLFVPDPNDKHQEKDELARELDRLARGKVPRSDDADHLSTDALLSDEQMGKPQRPRSPLNHPNSTSTPPGSSRPQQSASRARPDRPAVPIIRPEAPQETAGAVSGEFIYAPGAETTPVADEDDSVAVPAPTHDVFTKPRSSSYSRRARHSLFGRRTVVPILLTNGVLLPVLGGLWFLTEEDSPFRIPGIALPIALIVVGLLLLTLGLANALALRHLLRTPNG
jgi:hypothetical protein